MKLVCLPTYSTNVGRYTMHGFYGNWPIGWQNAPHIELLDASGFFVEDTTMGLLFSSFSLGTSIVGEVYAYILLAMIYYVYRNCTTCLYVSYTCIHIWQCWEVFFQHPRTIQGSEQTQSNSWVRDIRCNDCFFAGAKYEFYMYSIFMFNIQVILNVHLKHMNLISNCESQW